MAKWVGYIGYSSSVETPSGSGIYEEVITEKKYYGDLLRNSKNNNGSDQIIDGISISNQISILADPYAVNNFHTIVYITFMGKKWKVQSVSVNEINRLTLSIGGLYNG